MDAPTADTRAAPEAPARARRVRAGSPPPALAVVASVAIGGGLGATARYGIALGWPTPPGGFPWNTLVVNVIGCGVIGVFLAVLSGMTTAHPLLRPFFGTGVLGGFTTFSTYAVEAERLLADGHAVTAVTYLAGTLAAALVSVWLAASVTSRMLFRAAHPARARRRGRRTRGSPAVRAGHAPAGDSGSVPADAGPRESAERRNP